MKRSEESKTSRSALDGLKVDPEQGTLTAFDERFLVIPIKLIHSIEDRLVRNFGPATATMFEYEIGKEGGEQYMRLATGAGYKTTSSDAVRNMFQQAGLSGWGKIEVVDFDFTKKFARVRWTNGVDVRNSKAKTPVCHFVRGLLTGATQALLGKPCESLEVTCQGKGDDVCEAIVGDAKTIARMANSPKR